MDPQALVLTLQLALTTTLLLLLLAIPIAWWLASGNSLPRVFVQTLVALPLVLPPTVLGFYLLVSLGPLTAPGRLLTSLLGHTLAFSFAGLVAGSLVYSLPFAVQPLVAGFSSIDRSYTEAAASLGASPWRIFRTLVLPLSQRSLLTAALLTFTHTVGEFGVVLMLGGNIPGHTRTLSISLFDLVEDGNYTAANHTALLLLAASSATLFLIYLQPALRPSRRTDPGALLG